MSEKITNEELARMIARGFEETASKKDIVQLREELKGDIQQLDSRMDHLDARMGRMEADLHEVKENIVYKYEFEDLEGRVKYLESKLGIESGK